MADYTTIKNSTAHFNTVTWTGNGSARSITGVGFQPDWVWIKDRDNTRWHQIYDSIRGAGKVIYSNENTAEGDDINRLSGFVSDGFSLGTNNNVNDNSQKYVAWNWKAGGAGSANTAGSTNSTVSVNTTAGFSIVKYTGTGSNATVGHGLGAVPKMIFIKRYDSATENWGVYHANLGNTKYLFLNLNNAEATSSGYWNDTTPTSTLFSIGTNDVVNTNGGVYIAYCFAEKRGFSKFGSYSGFSNTNGPFLYTGFKPKYVCIKCTSTTDHFVVDDTARSPFNEANQTLYSNLSNAEYTAGAYGIDIVSNGIKIRNLDGNYSQNGRAYVWWAFADEPLVGDNPVTAR